MNSMDPFHLSIYDSLFGEAYEPGGLAIYELAMQKIERVALYTARDVQFSFVRRASKIEFYRNPLVSERWFLEVHRNLTDNEYRDVLWIFEYALAECKMVLGLAYRKFQTLSGPSGEVSLAGDQLVAEATERKRELEEEIMKFTDGEAAGLPMLMG